jgi:tyrosine-specific transport protein
MVHGNAEVGELIQVLSSVAKWQSVQLLIWWISLLAIATSVVGVGMGLFDSLKTMLSKVLPNARGRDVLAAGLTMGPAYLAVLYIPNAFITVLGFAGMILALLAVIMPVYLFWKLKTADLFYAELKKKWLVQCSMMAAFAVIGCELWNML